MAQELSQYTHYKGGTYNLLTIALPIEQMPQTENFGRAEAFHTELEETIEIFSVGSIVFSEKMEFLVLYQREDEATIYARPVDMFFEHVAIDETFVKRFQPVEDSE